MADRAYLTSEYIERRFKFNEQLAELSREQLIIIINQWIDKKDDVDNKEVRFSENL